MTHREGQAARPLVSPRLSGGRTMKAIQCAFAALLVIAVPAFAQNRGGATHQAIPSRGPVESKGTLHAVEPNRNYSDKAGHPNVPHVDENKWVGHDTGKNDPRYHMD